MVINMPAGNRTGPMGMGPRTGRGLGYCSGYSAPGYMQGYPMGRGRGWGGGMGRGRGRGWGWGFQPGYAITEPPYYPEPISPVEESKILNQTLENLKAQIKAIEKRIDAINKEEQIK